MSASLRAALVDEFNTYYKKRTLSGGVAWIQVRIPKRTFTECIRDGVVHAINDEGGSGAEVKQIEMALTSTSDSAFDSFYAQQVKPFVGKSPGGIKAWRILKAEIKNDIIYIECMKNASTPVKYNIEQVHPWWRGRLAKWLLKDAGVKKELKLTFEHGSTREPFFAGAVHQGGQAEFADMNTAARKDVMKMDKRSRAAKQAVRSQFDENTKSGAAKSAGASGTIVDKSITYAAKAIQASGDKSLGMLTQVLKGTLADYFNYDHSVMQHRTMNQVLDEFMIQGSIFPTEIGMNHGTFDQGIADQFRETFGSAKGQKEFVRIAQKWVKGLGPKRANKLWADSPGPIDAIDALGKKRVIDLLFPHKTKANMRYKVNKKLVVAGREVLGKKKSKTITNRRKPKTSSRAIAVGGIAKRSMKKARAQRAQGKTAQSPISLRILMNEMLPQLVASKMTSPALNFRTGRFANSARVENVNVGPRGGVHVDYTYQKDPYETFEPGNKQGSTQRDPRKIIGESVREIALGIMGRQPTSIRRN